MQDLMSGTAWTIERDRAMLEKYRLQIIELHEAKRFARSVSLGARPVAGPGFTL